jgi:pilus assembly protein Flp/PilA
MLSRFIEDESGATAIEYGLIAALIFLAIIVSLQATGGAVINMFTYIAGKANPVLANASG